MLAGEAHSCDGEWDEVVLGEAVLQEPLAVPGQLARGLLLRRRQREAELRAGRFLTGTGDQGAGARALALDQALLPSRHSPTRPRVDRQVRSMSDQGLVAGLALGKQTRTSLRPPKVLNSRGHGLPGHFRQFRSTMCRTPATDTVRGRGTLSQGFRG
jgi:hypothetical protein